LKNIRAWRRAETLREAQDQRVVWTRFFKKTTARSFPFFSFSPSRIFKRRVNFFSKDSFFSEAESFRRLFLSGFFPLSRSFPFYGFLFRPLRELSDGPAVITLEKGRADGV
jgi:hypothetical protein